MNSVFNVIKNGHFFVKKWSIKEFWKRWGGLAIAGVLLATMTFILSSPTIKTLRTVEIKPENQGFVLEKDKPLVNDVIVPAGKLAYYVAWLYEEEGNHELKASDYRTINLEVKSQDGHVIRTVTNPSLIKREDKAALLFGFDGFEVKENQRYSFVIRQAGNGVVNVRRPLKDQIEAGETVVTAFQLGEKRNWLTLLVGKVYEESLDGKDVASYIHRGKQIVKGENPYSCVLDEERPCVGYPAHLPGMYLVAAGFVAAGIDGLTEWARVWRPLVFTAWASIGIVLFIYILRKKQPALAVVTLVFWLFNRWSLNVLMIAHTDFIGAFFLILAVILANPLPMLAAFLLGVSLSVKQLAALVVPVFLLYIWRQKKYGAAKLALLTGLVLLMPLITTLPFFIDDPAATTKGLLNVVERPAQTVHGFASSFDTLLDVTGINKSAIMFALAGAVYVAAWRKEVDLVGGTLLIMAIMMAFTPVLYNQYFIWLIPFIPLAVANLRTGNKVIASH